MLYVLRVLFFGLFIPAFVGAAPFEEEALELLKKTEISKSAYLEEAQALHLKAQIILKKNLKMPLDASVSKPNPLKDSALPSKKASHPLLIFVSLSMPEASLQALYQEAESLGAVLVLRGLQDHSFKKTASTLKRLSIAVQIDPTLFTRHEVRQVPTFIGLYP
jgi:hypothetical protein